MQAEVYENVKRRGYLNGYAPGQVVRRNVVKLLEELGEVVEYIYIPPDGLHEKVRAISRQAAWIFDTWRNPPEEIDEQVVERIAQELADVQVVIFVIAETLNQIRPGGYDVVKAALEKSSRDIERGVR